MILINCAPSDPFLLWNKYKNFMAEDVLHEFKIKFDKPNLNLTDQTFSEIIINITLQKINTLLNKNSKDLNNYPNMPQCVYSDSELINASNLISEEYLHDFDLLREMLKDKPKMNLEQKIAFDEIINRVNNDQQKNNIFFVNGPGNTNYYKI
jgi:hypothetical protein